MHRLNDKGIYKMNKIIRVGNLEICGERDFDNSLHLIAVNGGDIVAEEVYYGGTVRSAVNRILLTHFDICTILDIGAAIETPVIEYGGNLISGQLAGFSETEYFKRIDDTDYFKHYTHRPMMA